MSLVPPIAPGKLITVYGRQVPQSFAIPRADVIKGVLDGSIPIRIYGFVQYDTGYSVLGPSEVGYCFSYMRWTPKMRQLAKVEPCP